ncbi:MAG: hypothetical protein IT326_09535 [Anaerolineae bacterium]|nr:hypothetical protein [Anaerolineae bacterium]
MSDPNSPLPPNERPSESDHGLTGPGIWVGIGLVLAGAYFLLQNFGIFPLPWMGENWWFIFPAAIGVIALIQAAMLWQKSEGLVSRPIRNRLVLGVGMLLVAAFALFDVDWDMFWPVVLIVIGGMMLLNRRQAA